MPNTSWCPNTDHFAQHVAPTLRYTRNQPPRRWDSLMGGDVDEIAALTPDQELQATAIRHAGFSVLYMAAGFRVDYILVHPVGSPAARGSKGYTMRAGGSGSWLGRAVAAAGHERAVDRWLRESGLWTPDRAWAAERLSADARAQAAEAVQYGLGCEMTFNGGGDEADYAWICDRADEALDARWPQVSALGQYVAEYSRVEGADAARIAGFDPATVAR